jgi:hypothetical protein
MQEKLLMDTHAVGRTTSDTALPRWLMVGFVTGFIAVLIFHQGAAALLYALQWVARPPYSMQAMPPFGVPQVLSLAFWGGVWGVLLAATLARLDGAKLVIAATIFGAVLPTLIAWFAVAPLKGQPMAAGFALPGLMIGPIVNAAWGLGTGLGLLWFGRRRRLVEDEDPRRT